MKNIIINAKIKYLVIGLSIGLLIAVGGVYAATVIAAEKVSYDNKTTGMSATNMQDALDEAYQNADIRNKGNIVSAYTYNQTTGASNYCVTGEESTCVKTSCYKSTTANSCKAGDIIKYKVNGTDIVTFHVMFDHGTTITMQSQRNTISYVEWASGNDYVDKKYNQYDNSYNDLGPITILRELERITNTWTNVNTQTYQMGTTVFKTNAYTGCTSYDSCSENKYTLDSRSAKARMITLQEAVSLGCTESNNSCPIWMYNYTNSCNGCTVKDSIGFNDNLISISSSDNQGYWTMTAYSNQYNSRVFAVKYYGNVYSGHSVNNRNHGARAVVVVSK